MTRRHLWHSLLPSERLNIESSYLHGNAVKRLSCVYILCVFKCGCKLLASIMVCFSLIIGTQLSNDASHSLCEQYFGLQKMYEI